MSAPVIHAALYDLRSGEIIANVSVPEGQLWRHMRSVNVGSIEGHADFRNQWIDPADGQLKDREHIALAPSVELAEPNELVTIGGVPDGAWLKVRGKSVQGQTSFRVGARDFRVNLIGRYKGEAHIRVRDAETIRTAAIRDALEEWFRATPEAQALLSADRAELRRRARRKID